MWRSAVSQLQCSLVALAGMCLVWWFRAPELFALAFFVFCFSVLMLIGAFVIRNHPSAEYFSSWSFVITTFALCVAIGYNHDYFVRTNFPFEPFIGIKAMAVFFPLLCPPVRWVGWTSMGLLVVLPLHKYWMWDEQARLTLGIQEPYVTVLFVVLGGMIYHYRLRVNEIQAEEVRIEARTKALQQFANMLIASQHLINTPLQKIEILVHLLLKKHAEPPDTRQQFDTYFDTIRRVTRVLSYTDGRTQWDTLQLPANPKELETQVKKVLKEFE